MLIEYFFKDSFNINYILLAGNKEASVWIPKRFKEISAKQDTSNESAGCLKFEEKVFSTTNGFRTSYP